MVKDSKAYKYAKWCIEEQERKTPKYVKKQAAEWIDIVEGRSDKAYFDEKAFSKIFKILKIMNHPDLHTSMDEGLEDYAWFLITAVLKNHA